MARMSPPPLRAAAPCASTCECSLHGPSCLNIVCCRGFLRIPPSLAAVRRGSVRPGPAGPGRGTNARPTLAAPLPRGRSRTKSAHRKRGQAEAARWLPWPGLALPSLAAGRHDAGQLGPTAPRRAGWVAYPRLCRRSPCAAAGSRERLIAEPRVWRVGAGAPPVRSADRVQIPLPPPLPPRGGLGWG